MQSVSLPTSAQPNMLRALSKLSRARSAAAQVVAKQQRGISGVRSAQQQQGGSNVAVQQQGSPGQMQRNVPRSMITSPSLLSPSNLLPRGIGSLFRDLERMMEDPSTLMTPQERQALAPFVNNPSLGAVDVKETEKAYEFDVDIPGLTKDEVQVMVNRDGVLTIKGERKFEEQEGDDKSSGYRRVERAFGEFVRRFQLPENTDPEKIQAKVENGVLKVIVPKAEEHGPAVSQIKVE